MKKFLFILLMITLLFTVVACNVYEDDIDDLPNAVDSNTTPPACEHQWINADCDSPKTCSLCQATEGEALGHSTAAEGDKAATCTDKAFCSVCQSEYGEALGHDMVAATCTEPSTCKNGCGLTEGDALGHDMVTDAAVAPTCTATGLTEGSHCSRCDAATTAQTVVPALGHSTDAEGDRVANCTEKAYCSVCKSEYGDFSHEEETIPGVPATCTQTGLSDWKKCTLCGTTTVPQTVVPFTHSGEWTITAVPTYGNVWKKIRTCSLCGTEEAVEIPSDFSVPETLDAPIYPEGTGSGGMKIKLVEGGKAVYTIVSASAEYDQLAQFFAATLRTKLGVTFTVVKSAQQSSASGKKIVIGTSPTKLLTDPSNLSYLGLLSTSLGNSIYISGYLEETVIAAVERFEAIDLTPYISTGSDGKKLVSVPTNVLSFITNPTNYINPNPTLFGVPLSNYTLIVPKTMSATENFCILRLIDEIGRYTGVYLPVKTEDEATGSCEIVFGKTALAMSQSLYENLSAEQYAMKRENGCLYIAYFDYTIAEATRDALHALLLSNVADHVDLLVKRAPDSSMRVEKSEDTDVRVMTSNIVCAADANGIKDIEKPYGILWQERIAIVTREIMLYLPDFVGMQEIQNGTVNGIPADMFTEILNNVSSEYAFVIYDQMKDNPGAYWNPILYRKTVWQIEAQDVLYPGDFDNAMHRWQWALFSKIEDPSQKYILLNLHNPTRSGNLPGQLAAADIVNAKIRELKELYPGVPIILTGDFNTELDTETYQRTIANTDVRCAYTLTDNCNDLGDLTGKETSTSKDDVIDHIMVSTDLLNVIACRKINGDYMALTSDHRPIFVDISVK